MLTPYDWIEFSKDYETNRALKKRMAREEFEEKIKKGEESDDDEPDARELRQERRMQTMQHCEFLKVSS